MTRPRNIHAAKISVYMVADDSIDWVEHFPYLVSLISENGRVYEEVERRIANPSKVFRALQHAVFKDSHLSVDT